MQASKGLAFAGLALFRQVRYDPPAARLAEPHLRALKKESEEPQSENEVNVKGV